MKTITIKQPFPYLIFSGIKDIENRTWPTKLRGRVLVHSSAKRMRRILDNESGIITDEQWNAMGEKARVECVVPSSSTGVIIGSVEIVDCVINHESIWAYKTPNYTVGINPKLYEEMTGQEVIYNWVLANPILFPEPLTAKGKLSFWDYPNILSEPEEKDGELFCHCQLPVNERVQVSGDFHFGYHCRYCGGKWYK